MGHLYIFVQVKEGASSRILPIVDAFSYRAPLQVLRLNVQLATKRCPIPRQRQDKLGRRQYYVFVLPNHPDRLAYTFRCKTGGFHLQVSR